MNGAGEALGLYRGNGSVSGECENRRMQSGRNGTLGRIRRETGLKPLNDFRLKAGLRREGFPPQTSLSEYRLQAEVCEGLQARVVGIRQGVGGPQHTGRDGARPSSSVATGGHWDWRDDLRVVRVR